MIGRKKTGIEGLSSLLHGRSVALIGLGRTHLPLFELFFSLGAASLSARDRKEGDFPALKSLGVKLCLGDGYLEELNEDVILRTPAMRPDHPALEKARARGALVTSEMELFLTFCPCMTFAVTGSDGKTTTSTLTAKLLEKSGRRVFLGGNIGLPLLPQLADIREYDAAVVELSSFQLMGMRVSPEHALITNLSENHLDWHTDMDEYCHAKHSVFLHQDEGGLLVLNADNAYTAPLGEKARGRVRFFSRKEVPDCGTYALSDGILHFCENGAEEALFSRKDILIPGDHNLENYLAAIALTHDYITAEDARFIAETFGGVAHRIELVKTVRGVRYYNSSIDSSPARSTATLKAFSDKPVVIMGGYDKHLNYGPLAPVITERVRALVLTGQTAKKIREALENYAPFASSGIELYEEASFAEAFRRASLIAREGEAVLLSPASASFDQFRDFEERGEVFRTLVRDLEEHD